MVEPYSFCPFINGQCKIEECRFKYQLSGNPKATCGLAMLPAEIEQLSRTIELVSRSFQTTPFKR